MRGSRAHVPALRQRVCLGGLARNCALPLAPAGTLLPAPVPLNAVLIGRATRYCGATQVSQRVATRGSDGRSGARKPRAAPSPLDPPPPPTRKDTPTPGSDGRSAGRSGRRNNATPPSANRAVGDAPLHIPIGDGATALRIDFGAQSAPARRPNSLCALTQRFVAFFLDHVRGAGLSVGGGLLPASATHVPLAAAPVSDDGARGRVHRSRVPAAGP